MKSPETVTLTINDQVTVPSGDNPRCSEKTQYKIPTLCHLDLHNMIYQPDLILSRVYGRREGWDKILAACSTRCRGMRIVPTRSRSFVLAV